MTYDKYYRYISVLAAIKNFMKRHILLTLALCLLLIAGITSFLSFCGSFIGDFVCDDIIYGEELDYKAKAFLSFVSYEFAESGSEEWSSEEPKMPGEYRLRASTVNIFMKKRMQETNFCISNRDLTLSVPDNELYYGDNSHTYISEGLAEGDSVAEVMFSASERPTEDGFAEIEFYKILNRDGLDVTSAYNVSCVAGKLRVMERLVTFSVKTASKEYDATPIDATEWYVVLGSLAEGDSAVVEFNGTQTEIGTSISNITSYAIYNRDGEDVTYCYQSSATPGLVEVKRINITLSSGKLDTEYDGTVKINHAFEHTAGKFFGSDYLVSESVRFTATPIIAGRHKNTIATAELIVKNAEGEDLTSRYNFIIAEGIINIAKRKITVKTADQAKEYDREPFSNIQDYEIISGSLAEGDAIFLISIESEDIEIGTYECKVDKIEITNINHKLDVTSSYDISYQFGTLTISKRKIVIKSPNISKVYDSKALIPESELIIIEGSLLEGDGISCEYKRSITDVGSVPNDYEVTSFEGEDYYDAEFRVGTLEIFPRTLVIKSAVSVFEYNGQPHFTSNNVYVYDGSVASGQDIKLLTKSSITEVGNKENVFTADVVDANGQSKAKNYNLSYEYGSLVVIPSPLKARSGSVDILGEPSEDYGIIPPDLANSDLPPTPDDDDHIDVKPPDDPDDPVTNPPVLPPDLQYPSVGDPSDDDSSGSGDAVKKEPPFYVYANKKYKLLLRGTSYGNYVNGVWEAGPVYTSNYLTKNPLSYAATTLESLPGFNGNLIELKIKGVTDFYSTYFAQNFPDRMVSDVSNLSELSEYSIYFYDYEKYREMFYNADVTLNVEMSEYEKWVYDNYLEISPEMRDDLLSIMNQNGVYETSPTLISDVVYFLKKNAKYNKSYKEYPADKDTIIYFLTEAKEGICIHYAGAAALIYRAYGIPARVAVGYTCTTKADEWVGVNVDSHAWVEIFVNGGWYPIDPTPASFFDILSFFDDPLFNVQHVSPEGRPEITVEFPSITKYYDGKMLTSSVVKLTGDKLKDGHKLIASSSASITYVGSVKIRCESAIVVDADGNDVTHEYCLRIVEGNLTVLPIKPTVYPSVIFATSGDKISPLKLYADIGTDGESVLIPTVNIPISGVSAGSDLSSSIEMTDYDFYSDYTVSGNGKAHLGITFDALDVNGDGVYEYERSTSSVDIYVRQFSNVKFYDMTYLHALENGAVDIRNKNTPMKYIAEDGKEYNYLAITTLSQSKVFDGIPLTNGDVEILAGALLEGHKIVSKTSGERVYVGKSSNYCTSLRILDSEGEDVTYMYSIDVVCGILEITPAAVSPSSLDIFINKNESYDLTSKDWALFIKNYPLSSSVNEGENYTVVEDNKIVGIKQGKSVVEVTFAAVDLNFDGEFEYSNVKYLFNVSVNDPSLYKSTLIVIGISLFFASVIAIAIYLRHKYGKKEDEKPNAEAENSSQEENAILSEETDNISINITD